MTAPGISTPFQSNPVYALGPSHEVTFFPPTVFTLASILDAFNDNLDHIFLLPSHQLECFLRLLELESVGDETFHIDLTAGYQINRSQVAASGVPDGATDSQVAKAGDCDWELDVLRGCPLSASFALQ
jgi:hypothetical protein